MIVPLPKPTKRHAWGKTEQHVVLENVRWQTYEMLCKDLDGQRVRMNYDRGRLEFMTVSRMHEVLKKVLGRLIETMLEELGMPCGFGGSMTFRRQDLDKGLEPDDCYWIQNEQLVRGKQELDFTKDPPPDLAIEVELSPPEVNRIGIYAGLGVPEVWRFDGETLLIGILQGDRSYQWGDATPVFPKLKPMDLVPFLMRSWQMEHISLIREFRAWVHANLIQAK